jgi:hypothetical protein
LPSQFLLEIKPSGGRPAMAGPGLKARLFDLSSRIPLVRETADPWIFLVLSVLFVATAFAVVFPEDVFAGDRDARSHVIQVAAGLLVVLGAYFTAVNIRESRNQQAFDRLCRVIDQLGVESEAVRVGAVRLLESIALEKLDLPSGSTGDVLRARQHAVRDVLAAVARESTGSPSSDLAARVLSDLEARARDPRG